MPAVKTGARTAARRALRAHPWLIGVGVATGVVFVIVVAAFGITLGTVVLGQSATSCTAGGGGSSLPPGLRGIKAAGGLTRDQRIFGIVFASRTGLDTGVAEAWELAEESGGAAQGRETTSYNDWLNIGWTGSGRAAATFLGLWHNPISAAEASAEWMRGTGPIARSYGKPAPGILSIIPAAAGQPVQLQILAIAESGWAGSGYDHGRTLAVNLKNVPDNGAPSKVNGDVSCGVDTAQSGSANLAPDGWIPNRLDMGYDGTFKGKLVAPVSGTIVDAQADFSNWGGWVELRANQTPRQLGLPSNVFYFAEGVGPTVTNGQHVRAGQQIGAPAPSPYGNAYGTNPTGAGEIEWGLAQAGPVGQPTDALALAVANPRAMVLHFSSWAQRQLGVAAPATTDHAGYP